MSHRWLSESFTFRVEEVLGFARVLVAVNLLDAVHIHFSVSCDSGNERHQSLFSARCCVPEALDHFPCQLL